MSNEDSELDEIFNENIKLKYVDKNEFFKTMEDILICPVCNDIFNDPYMCMECMNSFCKKCLNDKCYFKCKNPNFKIDKNKANIVLKLKFKCKKGCGSSIKYEELRAHLMECKGIKRRFSAKRIDTEEAEKIIAKGQKIPSKKVVLIGTSGVGKSSVLQTFISEHSNLIRAATIGFGFEAVTYQLSDGNVINFQIWDTAGQEIYYSLTDSYLRNVDGFILMYDITSKASFPGEETYFIKKIRENYPDDLPPTILVGNKSDLDENREVTKVMGIEFAKKMGFLFIESSAKTNNNISNVFEILFESINFYHKMKTKDSSIFDDVRGKHLEEVRNNENESTICDWFKNLFF